MFLKDPCGIVCVFITYLAIIYADYVVSRWIIMQTMHDSLWGAANALFFNTILLLLMMAHFKAVWSDPGVVPLPQMRIDFSDIDSIDKDCDWTICTRCETYRPPRAHHCRICQRCVKRMDHHCPWINNCVGERNQKYFIQFLFYVGVLSVYSIALIAYSLLIDCPECDLDVPMKQKRIMHSVVLLVESSLFGMFVFAILMDQIQGIVSEVDINGEQLYKARKPKLTLLSEVCGRQHPLMWLFPCGGTPRKYDSLLHYDV